MTSINEHKQKPEDSSAVVVSKPLPNVCVVTLNRPKTLNALNVELAKEMIVKIGEIAKDDSVRCVILTGAGRAFSSGAEVSFANIPLDNVRDYRRTQKWRYELIFPYKTKACRWWSGVSNRCTRKTSQTIDWGSSFL
jgi:enoyl-CoA hydratase/carnithine racemase